MKQFDEITKLIEYGMSIQSDIHGYELTLEELESDYDFAIDENNTGNEQFPTYNDIEPEMHRVKSRIEDCKSELKDNLLEVYEYYKRTEPIENFWVALINSVDKYVRFKECA